MTTITIVHHNGSDVVDLDEVYFVEQRDFADPYGDFTVRVWYSDPKDDDSDYTDYHGAEIVEVDP